MDRYLYLYTFKFLTASWDSDAINTLAMVHYKTKEQFVSYKIGVTILSMKGLNIIFKLNDLHYSVHAAHMLPNVLTRPIHRYLHTQ